MNKTVSFRMMTAAAVAALALAGCATTGSTASTNTTDGGTGATSPAAEQQALVNANNVAVAGTEQEIIDWDGRLDGEPAAPAWLKTLRHGNASAYIYEYGLQGKANRKWLVPVAGESRVNWEDGLIAAQANAFEALSESIATDINASLGSTVSDGAKHNIKTVVTSSINTVSGAELEGSFWQQVRARDTSGSPYVYWRVFAFYSMDQDAYQQQLDAALITILTNKDLSQEEVSAVRAAGQSIMDKNERESAAHEAAMEREQQRVLAEYQNQQALAREQTQQVQAQANVQMNADRQQAQADIAASNANAAASIAASGSSISPELAYLLGL